LLSRNGVHRHWSDRDIILLIGYQDQEVSTSPDDDIAQSLGIKIALSSITNNVFKFCEIKAPLLRSKRQIIDPHHGFHRHARASKIVPKPQWKPAKGVSEGDTHVATLSPTQTNSHQGFNHSAFCEYPTDVAANQLGATERNCI
jgi:hypothetical protein